MVHFVSAASADGIMHPVARIGDVVKKGQIVDCGKQGELLERCPLYADMWQAHIGAKNWSVGEKKEVAGNV